MLLTYDVTLKQTCFQKYCQTKEMHMTFIGIQRHPTKYISKRCSYWIEEGLNYTHWPPVPGTASRSHLYDFLILIPNTTPWENRNYFYTMIRTYIWINVIRAGGGALDVMTQSSDSEFLTRINLRQFTPLIYFTLASLTDLFYIRAYFVYIKHTFFKSITLHK